MAESFEERIAVVGGGRLAGGLIGSYQDKIRVVLCRDSGAAASLARRHPYVAVVNSLDDLLAATPTVIWIATVDRAIAAVADDISRSRDDWSGILLVHSSGATPLLALAPFAARGGSIAALHPNTAITGDSPIPVGLVWGVEYAGVDPGRIERLISPMGPRTVQISGANRDLYHAAASAAANYTVTLFALATELYRRAGIAAPEATAIVAGFMREAVERSAISGPATAITGPIVRGDVEVVGKQISAVRGAAGEFGDLYAELARTTIQLFSRNDSLLWGDLFESPERGG